MTASKRAIREFGIRYEVDYPYLGSRRRNPPIRPLDHERVYIRHYRILRSFEDAFMPLNEHFAYEALRFGGPMIASVFATPEFIRYRGGIIRERGNMIDDMPHAVVIVGMDRDLRCFKIQSSYTEWGDQAEGESVGWILYELVFDILQPVLTESVTPFEWGRTALRSVRGGRGERGGGRGGGPGGGRGQRLAGRGGWGGRRQRTGQRLAGETRGETGSSQGRRKSNVVHDRVIAVGGDLVFATKEQEETSQVLTQVLRVVNNVDEANSEARTQCFQGVVEFLASELFNANASLNVSKIVQSCLALLASRTGSEVSELLEPLYQPLLQPLVIRSLRSETVDQQVGTVTALNFCLALRPQLLKLTQELVSLQDVLQIAEADESVWVVKFMNPKVVTLLNKLRTACIELLCTAMAWADFKTPNHSELQAKVISVFFKSLTSRTPEIVAAKEGLRQVILQHRMPKELLQSSLRPILVNLTHTKNLSMPLWQGLARLLELLSNWFNVTLGGKLLEHLKKWLEPEKLAQCQTSWKPGEEPKIAAAIIELFHLLPNAAGKFHDELVTLTIDLETALPPGQFYSEINSPYRLPVTKFLKKYLTAGVDYFLARLNQPKYFRRFMYIIRSDAGQPLREELAKSTDKILANAFSEFLPKSEASAAQTTFASSSVGDEALVAPPPEPSNQPAAATAGTTDAYLQGLALIKTLVKLMPGWLHSNRAVFDILVARIARLQNEQERNLVQVKESKWLVKCFLNYLRNDKTEVSVLFDILSIFLFHTCIDFTSLKEFYIIEVAKGYVTNMKKILLLHFLDTFQSKQLGHDHLVVIMQMLILPMLAHTFQNNQTWDVVDTRIIKTVVVSLLDPPEEVSADYDEPLRIELLQLATLLLKYLQTDLVHYRKELIKYGWNHLKCEDSASKQWAFVNVCHFLEAYQAPEKFILQVFVAFLRTCQPENKMLVKQALDILMPALPRRLPMGDSRMPIWIRYTKKILVEEGHSVPNLIHSFQLIVRHSDLFYNCRAQFVPQMADLGVKTKTELMADKSGFIILLMTVIATSAEPELHDPKDESVVNICRHFAILFHIENASGNASSSSAALVGSLPSSSTKSRNNTPTNLQELDPMIFLDALVEVLADENRTHAKSALSALDVFAETLLFLARSRNNDVLLSRGGPGTPMIVSSPSMSPVYSPPASIRIPVFEQLLPRLLHCCCGSTWKAQIGGVMGLGALVGKVTVETLCIFQVRIIPGLVYVLKRLPVLATKEQEETSQVLTQVLRVVNNVDEANSEAHRQSYQGVVEFLASELFNANASLNVRKIVQSCLALLASRTGSEVSELLELLYQPLLQPLIVRSLRSKTVDQQVETLTALNFSLALRPPLLKLTQELVSFLQDALQIAEADESVWIVKFMNPKVVTSSNKLRTAYIELLCTTMAWADFKTPNHSELREKVIYMFFNSLTSRTPEIVAVAKEGLTQVILQQRMPKELLQISLRPILENLAHTKNLSMPLLQGLELLSNLFNVTSGGKLWEHLKKWLEPEKNAQCQKSWKPGEEPKEAAGYLLEIYIAQRSADTDYSFIAKARTNHQKQKRN